MSTPWKSLYFLSAEQAALAERLRSVIDDLGYTHYDPFGAFPGKAYADSMRLFVAPAVDGVVRVLGTIDERLCTALPDMSPCLLAALDGQQATLALYVDGVLTESPDVLADYLVPACSRDDLLQAWQGGPTLVGPSGKRGRRNQSEQSGTLPIDALPDDVKQMAEGVNIKQAERMFNRLSRRLLRGSQDADSARDLLSGGPDWNSSGGQRIAAVLNCLRGPDDWQSPDFTAVRDAYQLQARRQRKPDARLYPGDAEIMQQVPDALEYVPVYGGKQ